MNSITFGKSLWDFSISGEAVILEDNILLSAEMYKNKILITHSPTPDIYMCMQHALAIITETGGVLCHAAVLALEMGCPIIVGANQAMQLIQNGTIITLESKNGIGVIYEKNVF